MVAGIDHRSISHKRKQIRKKKHGASHLRTVHFPQLKTEGGVSRFSVRGSKRPVKLGVPLFWARF